MSSLIGASIAAAASRGAVDFELAAPTLAVTVSGTTATASITGDSGVTNYLVYKIPSETAWTAGGNRAGDGDIAVAGLSEGVRYTFVAYSLSDGGFSPPSIPVSVLIEATVTGAQDSALAAEADTFLDLFGESVTYYPKGGGSRGITAIVDRNPVAGLNGVPHGNTPKMVVSVKNDADDGISSSELETGGDKIALAVRLGETALQWRISALNWQDAGMLYLGIG